MVAATSDDATKVKDLIAKGADVNAQNKWGSTALMGASAGGYTDVVKALVENKADVNAKARTGEQRLGRADSIAVGTAQVRNIPVYVFDPPQAMPLRLNQGINYHGILGYSFLSHFVTTIDYGKQKVRFENIPSHPSTVAPTSGVSVVSFDLAGNLIHVKANVNRRGVFTFIFDTGAAETVIFPTLGSLLSLKGTPAANQPEASFVTLSNLALGSAEVDDVLAVVHLPPQERTIPVSYQGIIGYSLLSQFTITVNYKHRTILLERNQKAQPDPRQRRGIPARPMK